MVSVPAEGGMNFVMMTDNTNNVCGPVHASRGTLLTWWSNSQVAISPDGTQIAYLSQKNDLINIMTKSTDKNSSSTQRTFRGNINDLCWSNNGDKICFSESHNTSAGSAGVLNLINSTEGSVMQQISGGGADDYGAAFSDDDKLIFFNRRDYTGYSIWSYNTENSQFSCYSKGITPNPIKGEKAYLCSRVVEQGKKDMGSEIWKINYDTGTEELVLSRPEMSFTTPKLSPDGKWIICVGNTKNSDSRVQNTDIYAVRSDGSNFMQLTYHLSSDVSPCWSPDGKSIYFLSRRGNKEGKWNVWKMNFSY